MSEALRRYLGDLESALASRRAAGLHRGIERTEGIDVTSNDYLGYARDADLAATIADALGSLGNGSGASRLLGGEQAVLAKAEAALARFCGRESALLFSSGYAANIGIVGALAQDGDVIFSDALNHASLIDGVRLCRAERRIFRHRDLGHLEALLRKPRKGRAFVVTESVFSMDGDLADLEALSALCERYQGMLLVDEAHATGLYGERGSGRVEACGLENEVLCSIHTAGKALGLWGAWVSGPRVLREQLVNHCRSFIYSTAPPPSLAAGLLAVLGRFAAEPGRRAALVHAKAETFRQRLRQTGVPIGSTASQIVPVHIGDSGDAVRVATLLREAGFYVRAVRPPTVPEGTARIRVTIRAPIADDDLARLASLLGELAGSTG